MNILPLHALLLLLPLIPLAPCAVDYLAISNFNDPLPSEGNIEYRLSRDVVPHTYAIEINLDEEIKNKKTFRGTVEILVHVLKETTRLILHAVKLDINPDHVSVIDELGESLAINPSIPSNATTETIAILLKTAVQADTELTVRIKDYQGVLHDDLAGIYKTSYKKPDGKISVIAATRFEPTFARRAFPCFDEPAYKAKFNFKITYPLTHHVLFNTRERWISVIDEKMKESIFHETPKMSTYLLAFVVSDHANVTRLDTVETLVWAPKDLVTHAEYCFQQTPSFLKAIEDFTGIAYKTTGIAKLDQIVLPDFGSAVLESWGLNMFTEDGLLLHPKESSAAHKEAVARNIVHGLSHQWFGNLVTLQWWSYAWLNEAFSTYLQYFATAQVENSWQLENQFVVDVQQSAMIADGMIHNPHLNGPASSVNEIAAKFDVLTSNKGASILRMLEHTIWSEPFKNGLKNYLKSHIFVNTLPDDLWKYIEKKVDKDVLDTFPANLSTIMSHWTNSAGYPVVNFSKANRTLVVEQKHFQYASGGTDRQWYIPVSYTTSVEKNFYSTRTKFWLLPETKTELNNVLDQSHSWIIANIQSTGFYRVNYDASLWDGIAKALVKQNFDGIDVVNRAKLVDDALNLARSGDIRYTTALSVVSPYLKNEKEYLPWYSALKAFSYLRQRLGASNVGKQLDKHLQKLLTDSYKNVTFTITANEGHVQIKKKLLILEWACELQLGNCVTVARTLFHEVKAAKTVHPDLRPLVYCMGLRHSTPQTVEDDWHFLYNKYLGSTVAGERVTILQALGCAQNKLILENYLKLTITPNSEIFKHDFERIFTAVYRGSSLGVEVALNFFMNNYKAMTKSYNSWNAMSSIVMGLANTISEKRHVEDYVIFLRRNAGALKDGGVIAKRAIVITETNLLWVEDYRDQILHFLNTKSEAFGNGISQLFLLSSIVISVTAGGRMSYS